jgi:hypothetical protein
MTAQPGELLLFTGHKACMPWCAGRRSPLVKKQPPQRGHPPSPQLGAFGHHDSEPLLEGSHLLLGEEHQTATLKNPANRREEEKRSYSQGSHERTVPAPPFSQTDARLKGQ